MAHAFILINCELGYERDVIDELKQVSDVSGICGVFGAYDIVAVLTSSSADKIRETVIGEIRKIRHIRSTLTLAEVDQINPDSLILIDSVNVITNGFKYLDEGQFNGISLDDSKLYCYYVITSGTYENDKLPRSINGDYRLLNKSQSSCAETNDLIPPCHPQNFELDNEFSCISYLVDKPCNLSSFENKFNWSKVDNICSDDIKSYNVYFLSDPKDSNNDSIPDGEFQLIANTTETSFNHKNLSSFKGCYYITALDRSGNESDPSDIFCRDNCPNYELPNVFTPNADGKNDMFTPFYSDGSIVGFDFMRCPRFVLNVSLKVLNREGDVVYLYDSSDYPEKGTLIKWDGRDLNGNFLPSGVYYYFANLDCKDEKNKLESISLLNIKFIELLHKLHFPSKKTISVLFILKFVAIL